MTTDQKAIRILAVDDHPVFRQGIAGLIVDQADTILVAEASNGREAIQQFRTHRPGVTLMHLQMPELSGLDATITIRNEFPDACIIVLTTYAGDVQVVRALKAGARGYLLKNYFAQRIAANDSCHPCGEKNPVCRSVLGNCRARHR